MRKFIFILAFLFLVTYYDAIPLTAEPPSCSPAPVQTDFCTALQNPSTGIASCAITLQPKSVVVVMGTAFAAYTVGDNNGTFAGGLFNQNSQAFADPNSPGFSITEGISAWGTGSNSGTDTFHVNQTQFNQGASIVVTQYSGLVGGTSTGAGGVLLPAAIDASLGNQGTAGGSGNISGGNLSVSNIGDVVAAFGIAANNGQTLSVGSGYTQDANFHYSEQTVGTYVTGAAEHQISSVTGSFPANFTVSASGLWGISGVALIPSCALNPKDRVQVY